LFEDLEKEGASADDPRTRLAKELRDLAKQLQCLAVDAGGHGEQVIGGGCAIGTGHLRPAAVPRDLVHQLAHYLGAGRCGQF